VREIVDHTAHLLPQQGPIGVFVHHNTLHAFQHLPFERAVVEASRTFGTEPFMREDAFRAEFANGRIREEDIDRVLVDESDAPIGTSSISRRQLKRALVVHGIRPVDESSVGFVLHESDRLITWAHGSDSAARARAIAESAAFSREDAVLKNMHFTSDEERAVRALFSVVTDRLTRVSERPTQATAESAKADDETRDSVVDDVVHPLLIRLSAAFFDQGVAHWTLPERDRGFLHASRVLLASAGTPEPTGLFGLRREMRDQLARATPALEVVVDKLTTLAVPEDAWDARIEAELRALPGFAGMMRILENNPGLAPFHVLPCSLVEFLAVRLTLVAIADANHHEGKGRGVGSSTERDAQGRVRALVVTDVAELLCLSALDIFRFDDDTFTAFLDEIDACDDVERRRLFQLAYERRHEESVLAPLVLHRQHVDPKRPQPRPRAQVMFCIDEREESTRRHLEELAPDVETFGAAGFFGVAMHFTGLDDPHGAPLCPVIVTPQHAIREVSRADDRSVADLRSKRRRAWGRLSRVFTVGSRTLVRGWLLTTLLGLMSTPGLILRILAPRLTGRLYGALGARFFPAPTTTLTVDRQEQKSDEGLAIGFTLEEQVERVQGVLAPAGITRGFARLFLVVGHGSTSANNPHESAHDCGACGGRRGGPNARLYAAIANRSEVRAALRARGIDIPDDTWFVGGYHDTCDDRVELYDTDAVPPTHREEFARLRGEVIRAATLEAHERARRFEALAHGDDPDLGLAHVEARAQHLAEPRPEYGHCTNSTCIVGRRASTRGLFFDRRAFLVSYDAENDAGDAFLGRLLSAVGPVCGGINLEYYFSFVDNEGYGCGTKLPHNVTGLVGVMNGAASDLRTGLPWQMVEIHEPVRLLLVVESTPERVRHAIDMNPVVKELVDNRWIRIAALDPETGAAHVLRTDGFEPFVATERTLPKADRSLSWYRGKRHHLPVAEISAGLPAGAL
jgi:uncharacterized protein YbcC (UPF0753/DUF2309 family)